MAWSDAARAAAAEARRRKAKVKPSLYTSRMPGSQPVATGAETYTKRKWTKEQWAEKMGTAPAKKPLSMAQRDAAYARKQRKAGKASIFGGMTIRKLLKGFEY
jgi:hypothetical protein